MAASRRLFRGSFEGAMDDTKFRLERVQGSPVSTEEILNDIRNVAESCGTKIVSQKLYSEFGNFDPTTVSRRFGTWNKAVTAAGLEVANEINIADDKLFENLMALWEQHGRQPRRAELGRSPSTISWGAYRRRFRSWSETLRKFVEFANVQEMQPTNEKENDRTPRTSRDPTLRLRFRVLKRDDFKCRACGASPALTPGLSLHVDHVKPWSRGGQTIEDNLQTLCERCNLGKSNVL